MNFAAKVGMRMKAPTTNDDAPWFQDVHDREMDVLRSIGPHPNIVQCHGQLAVEGVPVCVLEFVDGGTLTDFLNRTFRTQSLDAPFADIDKAQTSTLLGVATGIARALAHLHACGFVHRDVKPDNVLMGSVESVSGSRAVPKLCDFGQAVRWGTALFPCGGGTLGWAAPEQIVRIDRAGQQGLCLSPATDVWSFGILLYQMLTGFRHLHEAILVMKSAAKSQVTMASVGNRIRRILLTQRRTRRLLQLCELQLVEWCLRVMPSQRPSMQTIVQELEMLQMGLEDRKGLDGDHSLHSPGTSPFFSTGTGTGTRWMVPAPLPCLNRRDCGWLLPEFVEVPRTQTTLMIDTYHCPDRFPGLVYSDTNGCDYPVPGLVAQILFVRAVSERLRGLALQKSPVCAQFAEHSEEYTKLFLLCAQADSLHPFLQREVVACMGVNALDFKWLMDTCVIPGVCKRVWEGVYLAAIPMVVTDDYDGGQVYGHLCAMLAVSRYRHTPSPPPPPTTSSHTSSSTTHPIPSPSLSLVFTVDAVSLWAAQGGSGHGHGRGSVFGSTGSKDDRCGVYVSVCVCMFVRVCLIPVSISVFAGSLF